MSLDYRQIHQQVKHLGETAPARENRLQVLRQQAWQLLQDNAGELESLRQKVQTVVRHYDPSLRCALPAAEALNAHAPPPPLPERILLLAADGSQIYYDRQSAAEYFLINIGTLRLAYGETLTPVVSVESDLYYGDDLQIAGGYPSEEKISLLRDLRERQVLAEMVESSGQPAITLTDGRLELWGASPEEEGGEAGDQSLAVFLESLARLQAAGATAAGYVDKPGEDYLVRLLEVAWLPPEEAKERPLLGVRDVDLLRRILAPGERSAVFAVQSRSARTYRRKDEALAPHFFYLNVGRPEHPWLARVDILAWVAQDPHKLDDLHAVLLHQCGMLGSRPYPYALHRAHEIARVTPDEKEQLDMMIANELYKHGLQGEQSNKQFHKTR